MEQLRTAYSHLRSFLEHRPGFTSAQRVFEPDMADTSSAAQLKRNLFKLANAALSRADATLAGSSLSSPLAFDSTLTSQVESQMAPAEIAEFRAFTAAIGQLVDEINAKKT